MKFSPSKIGRGLDASSESLTLIPAGAKIRMLRDQMMVAPTGVVHSRVLIVQSNTKPVRGTVIAIGPGAYPKIYDHADKHKRTKYRDSKRFLPTEVKVGDTVELGGAELGGYSFEGLYYGDKYVIMCSERDVAGVVYD